MRKNKMFSRKMAYFICLCLAMTALSGCNTLRRKFVRKKKNEKKEALAPVLDPIDYAPKVYTVMEQYKQHYMLWKVWEKDLIQNIVSKGSEKRQEFLVAQMLTQLEEMQKLVPPQKNKRLKQLIADLKKIQKEYDEPSAMRNMISIRKDLESNAKKIRNEFGLDVIEESLVKKL